MAFFRFIDIDHDNHHEKQKHEQTNSNHPNSIENRVRSFVSLEVRNLLKLGSVDDLSLRAQNSSISLTALNRMLTVSHVSTLSSILVDALDELGGIGRSSPIARPHTDLVFTKTHCIIDARSAL